MAALLQVGGSQVKDCVGKVVQQHRDRQEKSREREMTWCVSAAEQPPQ